MQTQPEQSHAYCGTAVPEEIPAEKAPVEVLTILATFLRAAGPKISIIVPELQSLSIFLIFTYY